jgi:hypothetical protein
MNWARVFRYGAVLFAAHLAISLVEGLLTPQGAAAPALQFMAGKSAAFLVCSALFAHLAYVQSLNPFGHALMALAVDVGAGVMLSSLLLAFGGGRIYHLFVALDYVILVCALIAGTLLGLRLRAGRARSAPDPGDRVE